MIKAAFFDIDGTLVSFRTHTIPKSTLETLREIRKQGVKVFIATGRPRQFLSAIDYIEPMVDGYITCNGAFCYMGERVLWQQTLPNEQARRIVEESLRLGCSCSVVGRDRIAVVNDSPELRYFGELLQLNMMKFEAPLEEVLAGDIFQVIPFFTAEQEQALFPSQPECLAQRWHSSFCDVTRRGIDKGLALQRVAEAIGIGIAETIAFGDGGNDIPMLRAAGIGVAMGNASDSVKAEADYVTTSVDEDGIANAFRHFDN